jgi:acetyl esterase/lipase
MSREQAEAIAQTLRESPLDVGGEAAEQRALFAQLMASRPRPADLVCENIRLGDTPAVRLSTGQAKPGRPAVLYFHGGGYAIGTAAETIGLPGQIAARNGVTVLSVDYRLAPENPFPAALTDGLDAYQAALDAYPPTQLAIAGESAGGGLALATLLAAKRRGLAMPAAAFVMSPWVDLTLSGASSDTKAEVDPVLYRAALELRAREYAGSRTLTDPLLSPLFGDFDGFPPLLVQAGSHECLLDDAVRLAGRAATDNVATTLDITPGVHHVFQAVAGLLDEADTALQRATMFLSQHLSSTAAPAETLIG